MIDVIVANPNESVIAFGTIRYDILFYFPPQIMVTNVTSLLKTVKAVEDEHTRGTRALESAIEAIAQEIRAFDSPQQEPTTRAEPEDLIRATRPITIATAKAVSAGKSCKQEDVIVAANMGRKAVSDMLTTCKAVSFHSKKREASSLAMQAGHDVAVQYRELLQMVMHNLSRPSAASMEARSSLTGVSRQIAQCVTQLAAAAENLKDDDWVDPSDPTFIAENELLGAAKSIENAAKKLAALKPRREIKGKVIATNYYPSGSCHPHFLLFRTELSVNCQHFHVSMLRTLCTDRLNEAPGISMYWQTKSRRYCRHCTAYLSSTKSASLKHFQDPPPRFQAPPTAISGRYV